MPSFARSFAIDVLAERDVKNPGNAVRTLFDHRCLPGEKVEGIREACASVSEARDHG